MPNVSSRSGRGALERTLALLRQPRSSRRAADERLPTRSAAAFRAVVDERLRNLERQLDEVKGRVNGLFLLLAGAVAAQLFIRLLG